MRILVAEDDRSLREILVLGLEDNGFRVDAVERGDDAIDQLKFYEYDVAILDWRMPGASGIDVVRWARRHDRPTALLMLTARDAPPDRMPGRTTTSSSRSTSVSCWREFVRSSAVLAALTPRSSPAAGSRWTPSRAWRRWTVGRWRLP